MSSTEKRRKKSSGGFYLHSTPEQLNMKDKRDAILADTVFIWLYLTGMFGWLVSTFQMTILWLLLLLGLLLIAAGLSALNYGNAKVKKIGILISILLSILMAVVFHKGLLSGLNLMLNQAIDVLGKTFPYMWPTYGISVAEEMYPMAAASACLWCAVFFGFLGQYIIKSGNRLLLSLHLILIFLVQMIFQTTPTLFWNVAVVMALLAVWMRIHGEKLPVGRQRMTSAGSLVLMMVSVLAIFGIMQVFLPVDRYEKNEMVETWKDNFFAGLDELRYGGSSQVLPNGDFENLGSFETSENPVLEVTMTTPESYYLRGFTGSVYTGTGWLASENKSRWEYRDLFYWLHEDGFYGQETLGQAAVALGDAENERQNLISIENINGNRKFYYVPYELYSADTVNDLPYDNQKIGDENLVAGNVLAEKLVTMGSEGSRSYAYTALPNQITKYASFAAKLSDADGLNAEGKEYQKLESYYNQFVYENYVEISGTMRTQLKDLLGEANISGNQKHTDYGEAKQNILYVLNSLCTYEEELEENWSGSDFVADFLNKSKAGYSVHFASAATMMFRYYGIPARYVEGYLVIPEDVKQMTSEEPYMIDETHAHAWTEYYQDGVGWVPFETTPSYLNVMPKAEEYQDISESVGGTGTGQKAPEEELDEEEENEEQFDWLFVVEILLLVGIASFFLLLLSFVVYVFVQRHKSKKAKLLFDSEDKQAAVRSIFSYTMNILAVAGLQIRNTSLYRYGVPIGKMFDEDVRCKYEKVVAIRQEAVYSEHEITEEQRLVLVEFKDLIWKRVYEESGWVQKFQMKYIYFL